MAAHEAEINDIIAACDVLDLQKNLDNLRFVFANLANNPKYSLEEINLAVVVDRQVKTKTTIKDMTAAVEYLAMNMMAKAGQRRQQGTLAEGGWTADQAGVVQLIC